MLIVGLSNMSGMLAAVFTVTSIIEFVYEITYL